MIWYLAVVGYYGATTYSPKPYVVEKTCQEQADKINKIARYEFSVDRPIAMCIAFER